METFEFAPSCIHCIISQSVARVAQSLLAACGGQHPLQVVQRNFLHVKVSGCELRHLQVIQNNLWGYTCLYPGANAERNMLQGSLCPDGKVAAGVCFG